MATQTHGLQRCSLDSKFLSKITSQSILIPSFLNVYIIHRLYQLSSCSLAAFSVVFSMLTFPQNSAWRTEIINTFFCFSRNSQSPFWLNEYYLRINICLENYGSNTNSFKKNRITKHPITWNPQLMQENYKISGVYTSIPFLIDFMTWCFIFNISLSYFLSYRFYVIPFPNEFCKVLGECFKIK